jgi:hypothetical protein
MMSHKQAKKKEKQQAEPGIASRISFQNKECHHI